MPKTVTKNDCNTLCKKCLRTCRQPAGIVLVDCPRFMPMPFKVDKHCYDQLDMFGDTGNETS